MVQRSSHALHVLEKRLEKRMARARVGSKPAGVMEVTKVEQRLGVGSNPGADQFATAERSRLP